VQFGDSRQGAGGRLAVHGRLDAGGGQQLGQHGLTLVDRDQVLGRRGEVVLQQGVDLVAEAEVFLERTHPTQATAAAIADIGAVVRASGPVRAPRSLSVVVVRWS
jgi:hypothetical protein